MSPFTNRALRPVSIARRALLPLAAGLALACNILPAAAGEADYPVGGTIAVGARVCETIPVDPFWECANAGGTGAIYLVSYAGDVVLTIDEAITHGGTAVWGEAAGVPMTGYTLHLENAQVPAGYSLYDIYVEPGVDGGAGMNGPYVNLTEQQPSAALYLIYIPDGENPYGDTDTDGDGMVDGAEDYHGTDPYDPDTDDDGLGDADDLWVHGTDPSDPDTDGDGTLDGDEVAYGSDPLDPADFPPSVAGPDDDGDGLSAGTEANLGTDPYLSDTDGDGADDGLEFQQGTDPLDAASFPAEQAGPEGDGASDAEDAAAGSDVADAADAPAARPAPAAPATAGGNPAVKVTALPNIGAGTVEADADDLAAYAVAALGAAGLAAVGLAWRRRPA